MGTTYDYTGLIDELIVLVEKATDCQLIESNSVGKQPDYPFFSHTLISPYLPVTRDVVNGEVFECVISLTCHDISSIKTLNLSMQLNKFLRTEEIKYRLQEKKIVLVSLSNVGKRDNFISIEYERTAGFDIRLRIKDDYVEERPQIENIEI